MFWLYLLASFSTFCMGFYSVSQDNEGAALICGGAFCIFLSWTISAFFNEGDNE